MVAALSVPRTMVRPAGVRPCRVPAGPRGDLAALAAQPTAGAEHRLPVLLVPGFTGSKEDFQPLLPLLAAAGHPVWAVDLRGQWESTGPDDEAAYAIEALADDLAAVLDGIRGEGPAHLVGHSFGGLVGRRTVLAGRPGIASYTLLDSGPAAMPPPTADSLRFLRPILDDGGMAAVWAAADQLTNDPVAAAAPADVQAFLTERFLSNHPLGLVAMSDALLGEPDRTDALRAVGLPLLVAHGVDDDVWSPAEQKEMAGRLGADYAEIPGSVHSPAVENPTRLAEVLTSFWRQVETGAEAGAR